MENLFPKDEEVSLARSDEVKDVLAQCYLSTEVSNKTLFPERFSLPYCALHREIFKVLDDDSIQQAVITAPRGWGKTSNCTIGYPAKKILFREKKFIVPVSATATSAILQGENLKNELSTNYRVKELFGSLKTDKFAKDMWVTSTGTMVMPRGAGQQIRGLLYDRHRPDLIVVDDLETSEGVASEEQRAKLKDWFFSDLCNSVNRASNDWKIVVIGTVLHEDALLVNLLEDPEWYSVELSLCSDDYKSNWPDFMSDDDIMKLKLAHEARGQLDLFFREYMGKPISFEDAVFRPEYFKPYEETEIRTSKS